MPNLKQVQRIYDVLGDSAVLLPLQYGTKKCLRKAWQQTKLEDTKVEAYVGNLFTENIGVSLGAPSSGLCSLDFDDDKIAAEFLDANPALLDTLRTRGARGCNVWVRIEGEYPRACKLFSRDQNKTVGEWRATGNYTAVWGKHPSGCEYTWLVDAPVKTIKFSDIFWPDGLTINEPTKVVERVPGKPIAETLLEARRKVAETMLDDLVWDTNIRGLCTCPGKAKHTNPDAAADCEVFVDGIPTLHCLHTSCQSEVARMNATLRQTTLNGEVVIIPDGYMAVQDSAEQLYEILKTTQKYFLRGRVVCEVASSDHGPVLEPVTPTRASATWEKNTRFGFRAFKDGETKITLTLLSEQHAKLFLAADERSVLPSVESVVTCPILYRDVTGSLQVHNDGYQPHTRIFVANPRKTSVPNVPLAEAIATIKELVSEFQFESPAHRSRAIMSFITPALVFSGLLGGRPPVDVAEADDSQAGKGYRQKLICAVYGETPALVAQRTGGVGSLDESFQEALIRGRPFIVLDNLRGKLDSTYLEAYLTAPATIGARGFGRAEVEVNVARFLTFISSNDLQITRDMANRSSIVRIRKQPADFIYSVYGPEKKDIVSWVVENQPYYLGCVYRIVQEWFAQGCPVIEGSDHDFRWWAGRGEWIVQKLFEEAPMLEGHRSIQERAANPLLGWLQCIANQAERAGQLRMPLKANDLRVIGDAAGIDPFRKKGDHNRRFTDDSDELRYLGSSLTPYFHKHDGVISLDGFQVTRFQEPDRKVYIFQKTEDDQPLDVTVLCAPSGNLSQVMPFTAIENNSSEYVSKLRSEWASNA